MPRRDPRGSQAFYPTHRSSLGEIRYAVHRNVLLILAGRIQWQGHECTRRVFSPGAPAKAIYAHRWIWEQHNGPVPPDLEVRHMCGRGLCVNIEHLDIGTAKQNCDDRALHGTTARGERSGGARLTEDIVRKIRADPSTSHREWARRLGVSYQTIQLVRNGRTWKHLL